MSIWGQVAVVGVYEHPDALRARQDRRTRSTPRARAARSPTPGSRIRDVDGFFTSGVGPIGILSLAQHLEPAARATLDSQAIGGSSFVSHCLHAAAAIAAGLCEVALVTYGSTAASERFAIGTGGGGAGRSARPLRGAVRPHHRRLVRAGRAAPHARVRHHRASSSPRSPSRCGGTPA